MSITNCPATRAAMPLFAALMMWSPRLIEPMAGQQQDSFHNRSPHFPPLNVQLLARRVKQWAQQPQ